MRIGFKTFNHPYIKIYAQEKQENQLNNNVSFLGIETQEIVPIQDFYVNGEIHKKWANKSEVGSAIVPSVYDECYQKEMVNLLESLLSKSGKQNGKISGKLLSVGCGVGDIEQMLNERNKALDITCVDKYQEAIDEVEKKGLKGIVALGEDLSEIPDKSQDIVYMDGSIGHMVSDEEAKRYVRHMLDQVTGDYPVEDISYQTKFHPYPILPEYCAKKPYYPEPKPPSYFEAPLQEASKKLKPGGYIVISDDRPSRGKAIENNPRVELLRVSPQQLIYELDKAGFDFVEEVKIPYERPGIGIVERSVVTAKKRRSRLGRLFGYN